MDTYAIGDVQGCHSALCTLLGQIDSHSRKSELIFLGDLVNRGPQSLATLREIRTRKQATAVLGNHDLNLLALATGVRKPHHTDTLSEILQAPDCDELLNWLRHQPLALLRDGHLMVHAGVAPQWSAEQTIELAHEVEEILRSADWPDFLHTMYGNTPARWDDALRGIDRWRCIVNALTRIRYCDLEGTMDFSNKLPLDHASSNHLPWFAVPGRKTENVTVVFGHWSTLKLVMRPNLIGLDTGCVWGGKLSAIRLQDRLLLQTDCHKKPMDVTNVLRSPNTG